MHHKPGIWNGMWSDMYIETTFMRYGHGPGGLVGVTLKPNTVARWALSLHVCSQIVDDVSAMKGGSQEKHIIQHKEEIRARIKSDATDRGKLRDKLSSAIDPLDPSSHPKGIINLVTGRIT